MLKRILGGITVAAVAAATVLVWAGPAAATVPSCSAFFSTDQINPTGVMSCEVPPGITSLSVDAAGGGGGFGYGGSSRASNGGNGGRVFTTIVVVPGETLDIEVGEAGGFDATTSRYKAGGGGGWTAIFRGSTALVIAGGGGGGGTKAGSSAANTTFQGGDGATPGSGTDSYGVDGTPAPYRPAGSAVACSGYGGNAMTVGVQCEPAYLSSETGTPGGASGSGVTGTGGDGIGLNSTTTGANRYHGGMPATSNYNYGAGSGGAGYVGGGGGGNPGTLGGGSGGGGSSYVAAGSAYFGTATNAGLREGSSTTSPGSGYLTLYSVPSSPVITGVTPGDSSATVAFSGPSNNGGGLVNNYKYSTNGGTSWTALSWSSSSRPPASGSFTISGLANGTSYNIQIRAMNSYGDGVPSATAAVTPVAPTLAPITPGSNPNLPASGVPLGQSVFLVDGVLTSATVAPNAGSSPTGLEVTGTGFTMGLKGLGTGGAPLGLTADGALLLENDRTAFVEGTGFKPNTDVEVYLFSTPRLLGTVRTNGSGSFSGSVPIPTDIAYGHHTLQSNGYSPSGSVRSLSLGVQLNASGTLPNTGVSADSMRQWGLSALLAGAMIVSSPSLLAYLRRRRR